MTERNKIILDYLINKVSDDAEECRFTAERCLEEEISDDISRESLIIWYKRALESEKQLAERVVDICMDMLRVMENE